LEAVFSFNILVEGLLNFHPRVSLQSLLDLLFPAPLLCHKNFITVVVVIIDVPLIANSLDVDRF
jgi:hypothetical protein